MCMWKIAGYKVNDLLRTAKALIDLEDKFEALWKTGPSVYFEHLEEYTKEKNRILARFRELLEAHGTAQL